MADAAPGRTADVTPAWPYRLPGRGGPDSVSRVHAGIWERFCHVDGSPVLLRAWERPREKAVRIAAIRVEPAWLEAGAEAVEQRAAANAARFGRRPPVPRRRPRSRVLRPEPPPPAGAEQLEQAIERARNALALDDDYSEFYAAVKRDPMLGPAIRRRPTLRARRCLWPWEAFAWAVTEQLIEVERAHAIQRRMIARWGPALLPPDRPRPLRDVPSAALVAEKSPAELAQFDLAPKRALALVKAAKQIASGRIDLDRPDADRRLTAITDIGPWTVQCLGQKGRGEPDSLPAGDLAYLKLVPRLIGMDRRATVAEVEEFYAPYAPYRGWAGLFSFLAVKGAEAQAPLRYVSPNPGMEDAA